MKFVFMGTPDFSVGILEELIKEGHECLGVVTQPDKPKGRGHSMQYPPVKEAALAHDINVYQPQKIRDSEFVQILKSLNADIFVVAAFGQILTKEILEMPKYGCVNVHASLLPKYRGASPIQWAVINGETESGVTTMQMSEGLDTGDILMVSKIELDKNETGGSLFDKLSIEGAKLCAKTLKAFENGSITNTKQDDSQATYTGKIDKRFGRIDWNKSAKEIEQLIRGLNPWPSAFSYIDSKMIKIWQAEITDSLEMVEAGSVIRVDKDSFTVKCGTGALKISELQLEGKKRMDTGSFLRGFKVEEGMILDTN